MSPTSATTTPTTTPTTPAGMAGAIRERFPLGAQWPTLDPFLFVAHHDDAYPEGTEDFGPHASLEGRQMGSDFAAKDGWNMYHGAVVPGFPQHPHRGFETITYVRRGLIDHADSLGAAARFGHGDTQWVTAGAGIVHSEMFPLLNGDAPNPTELFQIWLNLPAANKMAQPAFTMLWAEDTPVVDVTDDEGRTASVTVVVGELAGRAAAAAPAGSWAARDDAEVAIWHVRLGPGAGWAMPATEHVETERMVYVFEGDHVDLGGERLDAGTGALVDSDSPVGLVAGPAGVELLVMQGRPIGEPVAKYGPFVLNDRAGIEAAFADYRATGFGGWPWDVDGPVHGADPARFARHPDSRIDRPGR